MNCEMYQNRLSEYLDNELDESTMKEIFAHIEICQDCAHELELLKTTLRLAKEIPQVEPPAEICVQIINEVQEIAQEKEQTQFFWSEEIRTEKGTETCEVHFSSQESSQTKSRDVSESSKRYFSQFLEQFNSSWHVFSMESA